MQCGLNRFILILLLFILSCTRVSTLNLEPHEYSVTPGKIVWIQVAGLDPEHLTLLRYARMSTKKKTSFELARCSGLTWNYNLFELRPDTHKSLMSQYTGKQNIQGSCEDYKHLPIWWHMAENGYTPGVFESGVNDRSSLLSSKKCESGKNFLEGVTLWEMRQGKGSSEYFHSQGRKRFEKGQVYYDRSCQNNNCFNSLSNNVFSVFERFSKDETNYFFLIRELGFQKALSEKKLIKAQEVLEELDKVLAYFYRKTTQEHDLLVLVTSAKPVPVEMPRTGQEWSAFKKQRKFTHYRSSALISSVFSFGARAENFCGFYEEAEIFTRLFYNPNKGSNKTDNKRGSP